MAGRGLSERVSVVAEYDAWARSPSTRIRLPSVVALRKYQRPPRRVAFTRFNVFLRDRFACQYCGEAFASSALTFEHVIPRSKGGRTTWSNIVTACVPCNTRKGKLDAHQASAPTEGADAQGCWLPVAHFRPATCMRAGWTTSTGMRSSTPSLVS